MCPEFSLSDTFHHAEPGKPVPRVTNDTIDDARKTGPTSGGGPTNRGIGKMPPEEGLKKLEKVNDQSL
jgi:hypothetical protein